MAESVELYQIYYPGGTISPEKQKEKIFPFAIPYYNEKLTVFFENEPIKKLVLASKADKISVSSWKLQEKMRSRVGLRVPLTFEALNSDYEILSFTRNSKKHTMLAHLYYWHPGAKRAFELLWSKLGYKTPNEPKNPIYQNHWASKIGIAIDYVENFLSPAMDLILRDEELNKAIMQMSNYGKLSRGGELRRVQEQLKLPDYPLVPFVLERCPSCWFDMKGIKVAYL